MTPAAGQRWRDKDGGLTVEVTAVDAEHVSIRRATGKTTKVKRARFEKSFRHLWTPTEEKSE